MRGTLARTLDELAARDGRVLLLTGDLGFMALEPFAEAYPDRFFNVGVAEQNMVGLATGLAEAGFLPFLYSIATFASLRPYEFFRNGPIHQRLPVRLIGVGGGFEYGSAGASHHALEDVALMRTQPGLTVLVPADFQQARTILEATWDLPGPIYYRLSKDDRTVVPALDGRFALGRLQLVREGGDLLIVAMGPIAADAVAAAELLEAEGVRAAVAVVASVSPPPLEDLTALLGCFPAALTVEAHYQVGGLGSLVSELVAERGLACRVVRCGVRSAVDGISGGQPFLDERHGLSRSGIVVLARSALRDVARQGTGR